MSSPKKDPILQGSLSSLIEKFSHSDVIAEMEKEYQSAPTKLLSLSLIDDNAFVEEVIFPPQVIKDFSSSLQKKGFYNPVAVRKKEGGRFEVVLGRKRFCAAKVAGMVSLPAAVLDIGDEETLLMLLADTRDQREHNVVEMAFICKTLSEKFHYTQQMLADLTHQSRSQITNTLRVLKLPKILLQDVCLGELSYGQARAIASLPSSHMEEAAKIVKERKMSVRDTEKYCASFKSGAKSKEFSNAKRTDFDFEMEVNEKEIRLRFKDDSERDAFLSALKERIKK